MIKSFFKEHRGALNGKKIAVSGCTGGIGGWLCRYVAYLGGSLIMLDRNPIKAEALERKLKSEFPLADIQRISVDMQSIASVKAACEQLKAYECGVLIHNAGAYKIPREVTDCGYDNVFTINFISPYYITRQLKDSLDRVVVVGSIAHNYSKSDESDIDFKTRKGSHLVYGNAKRYVMYSHFELFKNEPQKLAVTHPGISLTGITAHYPKWLYFFIKPLMRIVFMKPRFAAISILEGVFNYTEPYCWIGPWLFGIWGSPKKSRLNTAKPDEIGRISCTAEKIYNEISNAPTR